MSMIMMIKEISLKYTANRSPRGNASVCCVIKAREMSLSMMREIKQEYKANHSQHEKLSMQC